MRIQIMMMLSVGIFLTAACGGDGGTAMIGDPCNGTVDCTPGAVCYSNVCVGAGPVRFSMAWSVETDIDLHVLTPAGNEIYFASPSFDAGQLDVDDCVGALCTSPGLVHVENVFFTDAALSGTYEFWAQNYDQSVDTLVTIEGFLDEVPTSFTETVPANGQGEGVHHTLTR